MRYYARVLVVTLTLLYTASLMGCATPPKKDVISQKDILIQNLTEENNALRKAVNRLTQENETLRLKKIRSEAGKEVK